MVMRKDVRRQLFMTGVGSLAQNALRRARPGRYPYGGRPSGITGPAIRLRPRTAVRSGLGITVQHDRQSVYRKKRMPYRLKRRYRRFVRKVHAVAEKDLGTRTVVFNTLLTQSNVDALADSVFSVSLYGLKAPSSLHNSDLNSISSYENTGNPTAAAGATVSPVSKYLFQSAILDLTFRNTSTRNDPELGEQPASEAIQELDIYEIICTKDFTTTGSTYQNLGTAIQNEINQETKIGNSAAGTNILITRRGVTPFDCPTALSRLGIKILKKTKYFIPQGSTITYQLRDPKRRTTLGREINDEEGANRVKWTRWLLFNYKLAPNLPLGTEPNSYRCKAACGVTRKYMYRIEGLMENRNLHVTSSDILANPE